MGSLILAPGYEPFDPEQPSQYAYLRFSNVVIDALGLQYATNNVGGSHTKATMPFCEGRKDPGRYVEFTKKDQDYIATVDSGVLCWIIYHGPLWGEKLAEWLTAVTGSAYTLDGLALIGERIWNQERSFNLRAGLTAEDICRRRGLQRNPV